MEAFYSRLSYSFGNEDWRSEYNALQTQADDRILCVTASGDRPLHLLLAPCREVVAIDKNPYQTALLELKCAAIRSLDYEGYAEFIGLTPSKRRREVFLELAEELSESAKALWLQNLNAIERGVIYQGATERYILRANHLLRFFLANKIDRLFAHDEIASQRNFVEEEWEGASLNRLLRIALHPWVIRPFLRDPGVAGKNETSYELAPYVYTRMNHHLRRYLARKNPFLSMICKGSVAEEALPPYLNKEGFQAIKPHLSKVKPVTADLIDYLQEDGGKTFDKYALSDVASYMPKESFELLLQGITKTANPGARFCLRQFLSEHKIPKEFENRFCRDTSLEKRLEEEDVCFLYRFFAGHLE